MSLLKPQRLIAQIFVLLALTGLSNVAQAQTVTWTVAVTAHEVQRVSGSDASDQQDFYWAVNIAPGTTGTVMRQSCSSFNVHQDDRNRVFPRWVCSTLATGTVDPTNPE